MWSFCLATDHWKTAYCTIRSDKSPKGQHLFPVLGADQELVGVVVTRNQLGPTFEQKTDGASKIEAIGDCNAESKGGVCGRTSGGPVVNRMVDSGFTRFPVLSQDGDGKIVGMVSLNDLLHARSRNLEDERARERVLRIRMPFGRRAEREPAPSLRQVQIFSTYQVPATPRIRRLAIE